MEKGCILPKGYKTGVQLLQEEHLIVLIAEVEGRAQKLEQNLKELAKNIKSEEVEQTAQDWIF